MSDETLSSSTRHPEVAFYYPGPLWYSSNWIKNLVLFFDGVALLVPEYLRNKPELVEPAIATPMREQGLLHVIEPETSIDKAATEQLAEAMTDIITSGTLDPLAEQDTSFHELSYSRLGYYAERELAQMIFEELETRGLARKSEDGVSIPMHPLVRSIVLVLLAQILRPHGKEMGFELSPATDRMQLVKALQELLSLPTAPSSGHVISSDLETVGIDLEPVPMDEVLSFRQEHLEEHRGYARAVRQFVRDLSLLSAEEQAEVLEDRRAEIEDMARDLERLSRRAWKRPASFALGITGAAWSLVTGDPFAALVGASAAAVGAISTQEPETGAYSYIFKAAERYA